MPPCWSADSLCRSGKRPRDTVFLYIFDTPALKSPHPFHHSEARLKPDEADDRRTFPYSHLLNLFLFPTCGKYTRLCVSRGRFYAISYPSKKREPLRTLSAHRLIFSESRFRKSSHVLKNYFFIASSTATATATVMPTIGLLPAPRKPIISTCAGTEELPANCASECMRPMVSVMP